MQDILSAQNQGSQAALILKDVPGKGRGVFAACSFRAGDEVLEFLGERRDVATYRDLTHALQVGPRDFLSASGFIDDFVNHACQPNCGIREVEGRVVLFALAEIAAGDEITFDYATTQQGGHFVFECGCASQKCRKRIGDFRDLPSSLQRYYIRHAALLPYLLG